MTAKVPGRRKLTELVPNHVLRHKNGHVPTPVMDPDRMTHHLRKDGRITRPSLQYTLLVIAGKQLNARKQTRIDEGTLLD